MPATSEERAAALWSFFYFFTLLAGYYVLRSLRDQMGIAGGVKALPWLFTATFITLLIAQPLYGALVARLPRARFIPIVYHFFVANLAIFWALLTANVATVIVARVFFVWVSVFSLRLRCSGRLWLTCLAVSRANAFLVLLVPEAPPERCLARP
jgi:ATP:ADP antiporter, AAA family